MIGKCPHCGIGLDKPPFGNRETNEVMLTMAYRRMVDNGLDIAEVEELGYCPICNATQQDLEKQKELGDCEIVC
jgi:hypothetical protein